MKIYTLGYSNFTSPHKIGEVAEFLDAIVIDIRFRAWSYNLEYCGNRLSDLLGSRYQHIQEFGNANYQNPKQPFRIVDFYTGQDKVMDIGKSIILMCTCKEYLSCHRSLIAPRLTALPEFSDGYTEIKSMKQILQPIMV